MFALLLAGLFSCSKDVVEDDRSTVQGPQVSLEEVARLIASVPLGIEQVGEVGDAVGMSSENGYDEEYRMVDLLRDPGTGVGGRAVPASKSTLPGGYPHPLRELLRDALVRRAGTRAAESGDGEPVDPDAYLDALEDSSLQIYWPFQDDWDGESLPAVTFDPEDGSTSNVGWVYSPDGGAPREVVIDEDYALSHPVWVINRNSDASYTTLEMIRRNDPDWGAGGGYIVVTPHGAGLPTKSPSAAGTSSTGGKALVLKSFTMLRNYDTWFAGASEFFVKCGSVKDFVASTEAELKLYNPEITDFMVVVRRRDLGVPKVFNAMLISNWVAQLEECALMIIEDDGGTRTTWSCTALVKYESKTYGVEISFPLHTSDDIVWRGRLNRGYLEGTSGQTGHFGDVDLVFELIDY